MTNKAHYEDGDMITNEGQVFRRVGWQINGGAHDKLLVADKNLEFTLKLASHGGYSPVYIQVGD